MNQKLQICNIKESSMKNQYDFTTLKLNRVKSDHDFGRQHNKDIKNCQDDEKYTSKPKASRYFKEQQTEFFNEKEIIQRYYIQSMKKHFTEKNQNGQQIPNSAHPDNLIQNMCQNILKKQRIQEANKNLRYQLQSKDQKIKELITKQTNKTSIRNSLNQNSLLENQQYSGNSLKNIKHDQFIFRIKLKLISTLQQLEIEKQVIEQIRNLQVDTQILLVFVNAVKEKFNNLKMQCQQFQGQNSKSTNSISAVQKIELISLQNQTIEYQENQKRLKAKLSKISTQYNDIAHKCRLKQAQIHNYQTENYRLNANIKQSQRLIQKLQNQLKSKQGLIKTIQKRFKQQKQTINQALNKEIQQKSCYLTKWQSTQYESLEYQNKLKRLQQTQMQLQREVVKWKQRSEWHQKEQQLKQKQLKKKIIELQKNNTALSEQNTYIKEELQNKLKQLQKERSTTNKRIQKVIQEWKDKLIKNVDQYQKILENKENQVIKNQQKINILQGKIKSLDDQNFNLNQNRKDYEIKTAKSQQSLRNLQKTLKQVSDRATTQAQLALQTQKQKQKIRAELQNQLQFIKQSNQQFQSLKMQKQKLQEVILQLKLSKASSQGYEDKINSLNVNFKVKENFLTNQIERLKQEIQDLKFRIIKTSQLQGQHLNQIKSLQEVIKSQKQSKQIIKNQKKEEQFMPQNTKRMYYRVQANSPQYSRYAQRFLSRKDSLNQNKESRQTNFSKTSQETTQKQK